MQWNCVLLVEDEAVNYKFVRLVLAKVGVDVDVACNGVEAIEATSMKDYALVLMDCRLPVMSGLEATKRIRNGSALSRNPNIPIIALTADVIQSNQQACIAAGMNDWATKPISPAALTEIVQKWLPKNNAVGIGGGEAGAGE
ncbi:MAG: response regulator [Terrimicrobiaceae bacterium]